MKFFAIAALTAIAGSSMLSSAPQEVEIPVVKFELPSWKCPDCSPEEQYVLKELQEHTRITDRNALATIMGNIRQESRFTPDICEGGARVTYDECDQSQSPGGDPLEF